MFLGQLLLTVLGPLSVGKHQEYFIASSFSHAVPLVTLPGKSSSEDLQEVTHLPVLVSHIAREFGQPTLLFSACITLVPSDMIFPKALKMLSWHGRVFLSLGSCLVLAKYENKRKW